MELDRDNKSLLVQVAHLGISRGMTGEAEQIFAALAALEPGAEHASTGLALIALGRGDPGAALGHLRSARQTEAVLAFSVLANAMLGERAAAEGILGDLKSMNAPREMIEMAQGALG